MDGYVDRPPGGRSYFWIPAPRPEAAADREPRKPDAEPEDPRDRPDVPAPPHSQPLRPGRKPEHFGVEGEEGGGGDLPPGERRPRR